MVLAIVPVSVFAASPDPISVDGVFTGVTSSVSSAVTTMLPYAAVILGAFLAIQIGIKIYRKVVGR